LAPISPLNLAEIVRQPPRKPGIARDGRASDGFVSRRRGFARREARTDPEFHDVRRRDPTIPISGHASAIFRYKELLVDGGFR